MDSLYNNAIQSLQLGLEDYDSDDNKRHISAVRNCYAGILLLAKHVLTEVAPKADQKLLLAARIKPVPDGEGGINFEPHGVATIDFDTIGARFKDFGIYIDQTALKQLGVYRKNIEHYFVDDDSAKVREALANALPVVLDLFRVSKIEPRSALGDTWDILLEVKDVFRRELSTCEETFRNINSPLGTLSKDSFSCPECGSRLVEQADSANADITEICAHCRACGAQFDSEAAVEQALNSRYEWENYVAMTDGGDPALSQCPECGNMTYIQYDEINGCEWCEMSLGECWRCHVALTPETASVNNLTLCDYCEHMISKDD